MASSLSFGDDDLGSIDVGCGQRQDDRCQSARGGNDGDEVLVSPYHLQHCDDVDLVRIVWIKGRSMELTVHLPEPRVGKTSSILALA